MELPTDCWLEIGKYLGLRGMLKVASLPEMDRLRGLKPLWEWLRPPAEQSATDIADDHEVLITYQSQYRTLLKVNPKQAIRYAKRGSMLALNAYPLPRGILRVVSGTNMMTKLFIMNNLFSKYDKVNTIPKLVSIAAVAKEETIAATIAARLTAKELPLTIENTYAVQSFLLCGWEWPMLLERISLREASPRERPRLVEIILANAGRSILDLMVFYHSRDSLDFKSCHQLLRGCRKTAADFAVRVVEREIHRNPLLELARCLPYGVAVAAAVAKKLDIKKRIWEYADIPSDFAISDTIARSILGLAFPPSRQQFAILIGTLVYVIPTRPRILGWFRELIGGAKFSAVARAMLLDRNISLTRMVAYCEINECTVFCERHAGKSLFELVCAADDVSAVHWIAGKYPLWDAVFQGRTCGRCCGYRDSSTARTLYNCGEQIIPLYMAAANANPVYASCVAAYFFYGWDGERPLRIWRHLDGLIKNHHEMFDQQVRIAGTYWTPSALLFMNALASACCSKYFKYLSELADRLTRSEIVAVANNRTYHKRGARAWLLQGGFRHNNFPLSRGSSHDRLDDGIAHPDGSKTCAADRGLVWDLNEYLRLR